MTFQKGNNFGNRSGRKPGSRNKTVLSQAQKLADDTALDMVRVYRAIMKSDTETLAEFGIDVKSIRPSHKLAAMDKIQKLLTGGIKELDKPTSEEKPIQQQRPHLQLTAKLNESNILDYKRVKAG